MKERGDGPSSSLSTRQGGIYESKGRWPIGRGYYVGYLGGSIRAWSIQIYFPE